MKDWFYHKWLLIKHFREIIMVAKVLSRGGMYSFRDTSDAFVELAVLDEERVREKYGDNVPEMIVSMMQDAKCEKELRIRRGEWTL